MVCAADVHLDPAGPADEASHPCLGSVPSCSPPKSDVRLFVIDQSIQIYEHHLVFAGPSIAFFAFAKEDGSISSLACVH